MRVDSGRWTVDEAQHRESNRCALKDQAIITALATLGLVHRPPSTSLPDRNAPDQVLQILVAPANAAAERERGVVQDVVHAGGDEDHRRARFLAAHDVLAEKTEVRVVVALLAEVEGFAGHAN